MIKRKFMLKALLAATVIILSGCAGHTPLVVKDSPIKTARGEGITVTVRFMDEPTLIDKFGKKTNPFLTQYYTMQLKRIMVFEVKVQNQHREAVDLALNRMMLQFGGSSVQPYNRFQLANYWEFRDEKLEVKSIDRARKRRIIKERVLPNAVTIPEGGKTVGFALFMANLPIYGQATVYLPFFRREKELIHRFEFTYEF